MPNTKDATVTTTSRILIAGRTGTGKTTQIWSLPGRKFAYIFDPNAMSSLIPKRGAALDMDYELFLPEMSDVDMGLKGFNKNSKDDKSRRQGKVEPTLYNRWEDHVNNMNFAGYDWLIIDSLTFLVKSMMDRQLFLNNRFGGTEEIADYKVVGAKLADVFAPITSSPLNIFCTAHLSIYENEKTSRVETQLMVPGRAKIYLPLQFTDIFLSATRDTKEGETEYVVRTRPDPKGFEDIRTSIPGLETYEVVTIKRFDDRAVLDGIGRWFKKEPAANVIRQDQPGERQRA